MSHTSMIKETPIKSVSALREAVRRLQGKGVKCTLVENAVPRMFYADQVERQIRKSRENEFVFHSNVEEVDYVLKLEGCAYDVGFIRHKDGHLEAFWDDWVGFADETVIKDVLGAKYDGKVEHWAGVKTDTMTHSIGKLLQEYSRAATLELASSSGLSLQSETELQDGSVQLEFVKLTY